MMQLFCTNEDMNSGAGIIKENSSSNNAADCYLGSNDSCDASPPYRSRCNTWPKLVRGLTSESEISTPPEDAWVGGSLLPLVSEETDELSEITSLNPSSDACSNNKNIDTQNQSNNGPNALFETNTNNSNNPSVTPNQENSPMPFSTQQFSPSSNHATSSSSTSSSSTLSTRRNPWGNCSYADLITQAIQSSPDQRLTVSQIYEWLVKNISFFSDKGDSNSSAGWKNSIRHNLSLHPKFVRVQNEGTGKSSWWIINPDVKPGVKPSRRRAMSMETSSARQRKNNLGAARAKRRNISGDHHFHHIHHSTTASQLERTLSSGSLPPYDYSDHSDHFRPRASSSASSCGRPGSPRLTSSSVDVLNSSGIHSNANTSSLTNNGNPWNNNTNGNGSSLSPTLFSVVEKLNLQDSMEGEASSEQSGDNLENIKLNDLNLDYETTKLLDSFLSSPTADELGCQSGRSEKEFVPITQQKIKILEQRESTSRGSSMSTSTPSSPPGMNTQNTYSNSFIHQPKIEEDQSSPPTYFGGGNSEMMDTTYSSTEEQQQILQPSTEMSIYPEQFKSFDDVFFENNDNSYIQDFSLNYFTSAQDNKIPPISPNNHSTSSNNKNNNLAPVTLNSY